MTQKWQSRHLSSVKGEIMENQDENCSLLQWVYDLLEAREVPPQPLDTTNYSPDQTYNGHEE